MSEDRLDRIERKVDALADGMTTIVLQVQQLDRDMKAGFAEVDRRFGYSDEKFGQIDRRFEQIDRRFEQVDQRFARLEQKMDAGFSRLERKLNSFETTQRAINMESNPSEPQNP
jgi:DNA anti-recombination protein RmuC